MTDLTAFEREVAAEVVHGMGPSEPVDDSAVFKAVAASRRSRQWGFTPFAALRFVAAAAIVALFGGLLLAGVLTTQQSDQMAPATTTESPSPVTTEELLSGMATEEIEPGIFRVDHDGVRDFSSADFWRVFAGHDGSIWLPASNDLVRLGDGEIPDLLVDVSDELADLVVAPDGSAWAIVERDGWMSRLLSFDGDAWTTHPVVDPYWQDHRLTDIEISPSGRVWAASPDLILGYLEADGSTWQHVESPGAESAPDPSKGFVIIDSDVWAQSQDGIWHYADGDWELNTYGGPDSGMLPSAVQWGFGWGDRGSDEMLWRHDETGWQRWSLEEQRMLPDWGIGAREYAVAPDGSIWAIWDGGGGISRFDGEEWVRFLPDTSVLWMDVSPDGAVWLTGRDRQGPGDPPDDSPSLYVVTPTIARATN